MRISLTDGNRHADELALLQGGADVVDEVAQDDADGHGEEDPDGQEAVEDPEALEDGVPRALAILCFLRRLQLDVDIGVGGDGGRGGLLLCLDIGVGRD